MTDKLLNLLNPRDKPIIAHCIVTISDDTFLMGNNGQVIISLDHPTLTLEARVYPPNTQEPSLTITPISMPTSSFDELTGQIQQAIEDLREALTWSINQVQQTHPDWSYPNI